MGGLASECPIDTPVDGVDCNDGEMTVPEISAVKEKLLRDSNSLGVYKIERRGNGLVFFKDGVEQSLGNDEEVIRAIITGINYLLRNAAAGNRFLPSTEQKIKEFLGGGNDVILAIGPKLVQMISAAPITATQFESVQVPEILYERNLSKANLKRAMQSPDYIRGIVGDGESSACSKYSADLVQVWYQHPNVALDHSITPWADNQTDPTGGAREYSVEGKIGLYKMNNGVVITKGDAIKMYQQIEKYIAADTTGNRGGQMEGYQGRVSQIEDILNRKRTEKPQIFDLVVKEYKKPGYDGRVGVNPVGHRFMVYVPEFGSTEGISMIDYYYPKPTHKLKVNLDFKDFQSWFTNFKDHNYVGGEGSLPIYREKKGGGLEPTGKYKEPLDPAEFKVLAIYS